MSTWVVPYIDQDLSFWEKVVECFGPHIREVYFPVPGGAFPSGRPPQPEQFLLDFLHHVPLAKSVLLNPIVLPQAAAQVAPRVIDTLRRLRDDFGVTEATITSLDLARLIKQALPDCRLAASTLMGIGHPSQVLLVQDLVDCITPDNRVVRDIDALKRLRAAFGKELRLIVNEACIPGCPHRTQHFFEMGYSERFPQSLCQSMLEERPWLRLTGAWILPRHLRFYEGLYDTLKLAGRVTLRDPQRYLSVLGAYVSRANILPRDIGGGPASPLNDIDMPDSLFEYVLQCDKECGRCSVCRNHMETDSSAIHTAVRNASD